MQQKGDKGLSEDKVKACLGIRLWCPLLQIVVFQSRLSEKSQKRQQCVFFRVKLWLWCSPSAELWVGVGGLTSVDSGEGQRGQTLALHLLLLLESPLGLQDWILKLGPSVYVAGGDGKRKGRVQSFRFPQQFSEPPHPQKSPSHTHNTDHISGELKLLRWLIKRPNPTYYIRMAGWQERQREKEK